jgi:hypothetical protein
VITLTEQIAEANREWALRRKCYPGWVEAGRMTPEEAAYHLRCQWAIVTTLRRLEAEEQQLSLFAPTHSDPA